jgi:hypothetical protein
MENSNQQGTLTVADKRFFLRQAFRNREDLLKLRISAGNRLVTIFKDRFPDLEEDKADDNDKLLQKILASYHNITDFMACKLADDVSNAVKKGKKEKSEKVEKVVKKKARAKAIKKITSKNFEIPETEQLIRQYPEYLLLDNYINLEKAELVQQENMSAMLAGIPVYDQYLSQIRGVGPIISAFLIAEIDIHKCTYPSQLHSFFGLAPVNGLSNIKANWNKVTPDGKRIGVLSFSIRNSNGKSTFIGKMKEYDFLGIKDNKIDENNTKKLIKLVDDYINRNHFRVLIKDSNGEYVDTNITFNKDLYDIDGSKSLERVPKHSLTVKPKKTKKKKAVDSDEAFAVTVGLDLDLEEAAINRDLSALAEPDYIAGERSLGYDVSKRGKLVGSTITPLMCHNTHYRDIRNGYKDRLSQDPRHANKSKAHRLAMSNTKMLRIFLSDLYAAWRKIENLPISVPYEEAKLGIIHGTGKNSLPNED